MRLAVIYPFSRRFESNRYFCRTPPLPGGERRGASFASPRGAEFVKISAAWSPNGSNFTGGSANDVRSDDGRRSPTEGAVRQWRTEHCKKERRIRGPGERKAPSGI